VRFVHLSGILAASLASPLLLAPAGLAFTQSATFNPVLQVDDSSSSTGFNFTGFISPVYSVIATINLTKCDDPIDSATGQCIGTGTSFNEEIGLSLQSPSGTIVPLVEFGTLDGQEPGDTVTWTFSDTASSTLGGDVLVSGTYLPSSPLEAFRGENGNGLWKLLFADDTESDPLSVNSWSLTVNQQVPVPGPLPVLGAATALGYSRRIRRRLAKVNPKA
jgi:hypothetical protein